MNQPPGLTDTRENGRAVKRGCAVGAVAGLTLLACLAFAPRATADETEIDCTKAMKVTWTAVNELSSAIPGIGILVKLAQGVSKTVSHSACVVAGEPVPTMEQMIKEAERISGEQIDQHARRQLQRRTDDLLGTFEAELSNIENAESLGSVERERLSILMQTIGNDASLIEAGGRELSWPVLPAIATLAGIKNAAYVLAYELAEPGAYRDHLLGTVIPRERRDTNDLVERKEAEYIEFIDASRLHRFATESHGIDYRPLEVRAWAKRGPNKFEYDRSWYCERSIFNPSACSEFTTLRDRYFSESLSAHRQVRRELVEALGSEYLGFRNTLGLLGARPFFLVNERRAVGQVPNCLGVSGGATIEAGDAIDLRPCDFQDASEFAPYPDQLWSVVPGSGRIRNLASGLCVERSSGSAPLFVGPCRAEGDDAAEQQSWGFHPEGYVVQSGSGECLDPEATGTGTVGAGVCRFDLDFFSQGGDGTTDQLWKLQDLEVPGARPDSSDGFSDGVPGALAQRPGQAGCVTQSGTLGECARGIGFRQMRDIAVAPDGAHAYAVALDSDSLITFRRNPTTGAIAQLPKPLGCISIQVIGDHCRKGTGLDGANSVAVSPDGMNIYVASKASDSVTVFDRNPDTGVATQKPGRAGCIAEIGSSVCADGKGLDGARSVLVSPDGRNVYVASEISDAVATFDRDHSGGALIQKGGIGGCVSNTGTGGQCAKGRALDAPMSIAISPEGRSVYAAAANSDSVSQLTRSIADGSLLQPSETAGCISSAGTASGCAAGRGLDGVSDVAVSNTPDGAYAYSAAPGSSAIGVFTRHSVSGALTQRGGTSGCISATASEGCATGRGIERVSSVEIPRDDGSLYATSASPGSLATFDLSTGGVPVQRTGTQGCHSHLETDGCRRALAIGGATAIEATPDGRNVYVAANDNDGIAVFGRDIAPGTRIEEGPDGLINSRDPVFEFDASEPVSHFLCYFDALPWRPCSGPASSHRIRSAGDGWHTFAVAAVDLSGNRDTSPAVRHFRIDATPPTVAITGLPEGIVTTKELILQFEASEAGDWRCEANDRGLGCGQSGATRGSLRLVDLDDGMHSILVRVRDEAGNAGLAVSSFRVDTTPPQTTIDAGPTHLEAGATGTIEFSSNEPGSRFECRLGDGDFEECSGDGRHMFRVEEPGEHAFFVRAIDEAGHRDPDPAEWRLTVTPANRPSAPSCSPAALSTLLLEQEQRVEQFRAASSDLRSVRSKLAKAVNERVRIDRRIASLLGRARSVQRKIRTHRSGTKRLRSQLRSIRREIGRTRASRQRVVKRLVNIRVRLESATAVASALALDLERLSEQIRECRGAEQRSVPVRSRQPGT